MILQIARSLAEIALLVGVVALIDQTLLGNAPRIWRALRRG